MFGSFNCNVPEVYKLGTPPDKWKNGPCLLDYVSVFSEKDLIALGVNQRCAVDVGFQYAKEVASLPSPYIQNAFLYFFWFVDRNLHKFRPNTIPRSKLRCQLLFLAARKTCQHERHTTEPSSVEITPTPRVRTSSSMRKKVVIKSPSLPEMASLSPESVNESQPAESDDAEVNKVVESHEEQVKTPQATETCAPVNAATEVQADVKSDTNAIKKKKKRIRVEARASNAPSTESSGTVTPKRKIKEKSAPVYEQRMKQEALEIGIRTKELVRQYVPHGDKRVTSSELLSLITMQDPVGNFAVCELIETSNLCNEHFCHENSKDFHPDLMQALEMIARGATDQYAAAIPEDLRLDAEDVMRGDRKSVV